MKPRPIPKHDRVHEMIEVIKNATYNQDMDQWMISLDDLWKAAGSPPDKEPKKWLQTKQGKAFIANLANDLDVPPESLILNY
jgi:hypothetical protein